MKWNQLASAQHSGEWPGLHYLTLSPRPRVHSMSGSLAPSPSTIAGRIKLTTIPHRVATCKTYHNIALHMYTVVTLPNIFPTKNPVPAVPLYRNYTTKIRSSSVPKVQLELNLVPVPVISELFPKKFHFSSFEFHGVTNKN